MTTHTVTDFPDAWVDTVARIIYCQTHHVVAAYASQRWETLPEARRQLSRADACDVLAGLNRVGALASLSAVPVVCSDCGAHNHQNVWCDTCMQARGITPEQVARYREDWDGQGRRLAAIEGEKV